MNYFSGSNVNFVFTNDLISFKTQAVTRTGSVLPLPVVLVNTTEFPPRFLSTASS